MMLQIVASLTGNSRGSFYSHNFSITPLLTPILAGKYYKHSMIVNDDSNIINKFKASLTDDARVIIYNCDMFIVQATGWKGLPETNTLAYFALTSMTKAKRYW